jgi:hypothetical protein
MRPAPPKLLERVVELAIPPACREHVVGDLRERYTCPGDYAKEAALTAPLVIWSRIRRTTDPGVLLLEALALYVALFAASWQFDRGFLYSNYGLFVLATPAGIMVAALVLGDAYASPKSPSPLKPILQSALAAAFTFLVELALASLNSAWAPPRSTLASGLGVGLVLVATLRLLFPPWTEPPKAG